jgi:GTP-binding protein YchF
MRIGIVGLPQAGKTTVFNMLTHGRSDSRSWAGHEEARIGVAQIPDARLERLAELIQPRKVTHATVEYVDLPPIAHRGREAAGEEHLKNWGASLTSLRNAEALAHVVRSFRDSNIPHCEGTVDPARDIALVELEMILSDLAAVEKRLERLSKDLKKMKSAELEAESRVLERFKTVLESEHALRGVELTEEESRLVRGFTFLSAKPLLLVLNVDDDEASGIPGVLDRNGLRQWTAMRGIGMTAVCGKIEAEIATLSEEDARAFLDDLGLAQSALERVISASYSLLGLITFFTVGENEVRAWTLPRDTPAVKAAGAIHTDFERGFIKAEVVAYEDMLQAGSFQAARSRGLLRLEGKEYPVQDGDVVLFRFNV